MDGLNTSSYQFVKLGRKKPEYYDDLLIKADSGLHLQVFEIVDNLISANFANKNDITALDIACGQGAFSKRLQDNGIKVESADIDSDNFKYKDLLPFHCVDINAASFESFCKSNENKYDIIVSMETIEHIENPWSFLRGLKMMCKPDGYIIVSTPNIETPYCKVYFLLNNVFNSFTEASFKESGHINPITEFEMKIIAGGLKVKLLKVLGGGNYPVMWFTLDIKRCIPWTLINLFLFPFTRKRNLSWCKVYLLKNHQD